MKAVVMAGGEGTRLRPLTSKRPKPLVPIANKPVMEHIIELLASHGITNLVATLYFLPQAIKNYFGTGENLGVDITYAIEDSPLGTAGSVKNAESELDQTFVVISGDALTDLDITKVIKFHKKKKALATIVLKRVENPLEFGVVIANEEGRIERFLEKPGWGQVFSDTINTGIYVLEPEILSYIPQDTPFDFSQELFPLLLEKEMPLYGYIADCYWCDIGNIEQFMRAQQDVLADRVNVNLQGIEMSKKLWIGNGAVIDPDARLAGPLVIGENSRIDAGAYIGEYSVIGDNVIVNRDAVIQRSVLMDNCFIGDGARIAGAFLGNQCDVKHGASIEEGAAIGDDCVIGENVTVNHHIKIYPSKKIDAGATVNSNVIWESRGIQTLFGKSGISGLINVDITPEQSVRIGMAFGTSLAKNAHIVTSRDASRASRIIKRAILSGINATGVYCRDLQIAPAPLNRFAVRSSRSLGGFHVGTHPKNPEMVQISFFDSSGIDIDENAKKNIEKHYFRGEFRRAFHGEIGGILYQSRSREFYVNDILRQIDTEAISGRQLKLVLDYSYGAASMLMPSMLGYLGCHIIAINPYTDESKVGISQDEFGMALDNLSAAVGAFKADMGVLMDSAGERIYLVDDKGRKVDSQTALVLLAQLACENSPKKGTIAIPVDATHLVEETVKSQGCKVVRTKVSGSAVMGSALKRNVIFAGDADGGYVFPRFIPGYDAVMSFCKLLEFLSNKDKPLSSLIDEIPTPFVYREPVYCPWEHKGLVMRKFSELTRDKNLVLIDGIKVLEDKRWALILPDADDPFVHVTAEGFDKNSAAEHIGEYVNIVNEIIQRSVKLGD